MKLCGFLLLLICLALGGCSRVSATTALSADGSYSRTVTYTINDGMNGAASMMGPVTVAGSGQGSSTKTSSTDSKPASFHSLFVLPDKDPSYKITQSKGKEGERILVVSKSIAAGGAAPQDIQLLSKTGKPDLFCKVAVQKLANGNLQYDEEIHWVGAKPNETEGGPQDMTKTIKPLFPERFRSDDAKLSHLSMQIAQEFMKSLFGPPAPSFADAMTNPDFMKLQMEGKLEEIFRRDAKQEFPDITDQEIDQALGWIEEFSSRTAMQTTTPKDPSNSSGDDAMTPLLFVVTFPGKVVETDGITSRGKVYWSMSAASAQWFPVHLHLLVNPLG